MKIALAVSLALHAALIWGADWASRSLRGREIPADYIAVSLVGGGAPAERPARAAAVTPPAKAAAVKPATAKPSAKPAPPKKQVPDIAVKPRKKPEPEAPASETAAGPVEAPAGPGLGEVRLDAGDFPFSYYLVALRNKIGQHWLPAPMSPGAATRATIIYFRIQPDGRVTDAAVQSPSGNGFFDRAALRAVLNASPLAPLPPEFPGPSLGVHLEFKQTAP